ncbi:FG-GAP-like repeat-containing protein [Streptomyces sp. NPDC053253]|uniref:FG-GAP-like repeat-containing protein n=1 Tax=Streptomyces sp. NPDC053253 TaxID=3365699 RepID=UPI0037D37536
MAVQTQENTFRILDMAGGESVDVDTTSVGANASIWLLAGDTLVMRRVDGNSRTSLHLVSKSGGTVVHRQVEGLPAETSIANIAYSPSGALLVQYGASGVTGAQRLAVVDLATAKVIEDRAVPRLYPNSGITITADRLVWTEQDYQGLAVLVTARRGTAEPTRHTTFRVDSRYAYVSLLGDWVLYGKSGGSLSALSLSDGTTVTGLLGNLGKVLGAEGGLLAQGTTEQDGVGVYRIGLGTDDRPAPALLATEGARTPVTVADEQVPATAGFATAGSKAVLRWRFGRGDIAVRLQLTHKATSKSWNSSKKLLGTGTETAFEWDGTFPDETAAHNGAYEWKMTATPLNGIGGTAERTGTLTVASGNAPHDYSDTGAPTLLVRKATGTLSSYDVRQFLAQPHEVWEETKRGSGWNVYDQLVATGNIDSAPYADLVARDKTGVLWLYSGKGHSLATRVEVGGGWGVYDRLTGGSDLTGDSRPDLVARDKTGVLWLYKTTGSASKPFAARVRIGGGWNTYSRLIAPGDMGGAKTGDLLALDKAGVMWLYLGKSDGTFAPRTRVGGGWNYAQFVNIGDVDRDGRADLLAERIFIGDYRYSRLTAFKGTGNWKAPFRAGEEIDRSTPYSLGTRADIF